MTPIRRQYLDIKRRFPTAIVFFRLGDFYETFDDDARLCARELDLVLTSRPLGKDARVPMAGIPAHSVNTHLARLIARGYRVAVCDQIGDPATSKGLVERQVTRVITPGTVLSDDLLRGPTANYLAALVPGAAECGLAWLDISTGEFVTAQPAAAAVAAELARLRPAELLLPEDIPAPDGYDGPHTAFDDRALDPEWAAARLQEGLGVASLEAFGCARLPLAISAAAAVLSYLAETQPAARAQVSGLRTDHPDDFVTLDAATRRNLELFEGGRDGGRAGSLLGVIDRTRTAMGARLLRARLGQPLRDPAAIGGRLDAVARFVADGLGRSALRERLGHVPDLERLLARAVTGVATPRDLIGLRRGLEQAAAIRTEGQFPPAGHRAARPAGAPHATTDLLPSDERLSPRPSPAAGEEPSDAGGATTPQDLSRNTFPAPRPAEPSSAALPSSALLDAVGTPTAVEGGAEVGAASRQRDTERGSTRDAGTHCLTVPNGSARGDDSGAAASPTDTVGALYRYPACTEVVDLIAAAIAEDAPATLDAGGVIGAGFSEELDGLRAVSRDAKRVLADLERSERERTGIRSLKIGYNRVFGYYIEISNVYADRAPADYQRRQTLAGAERYVTPELKEYESRVLGAEERIGALETELFRRVCAQVAASAEPVRQTAAALAALDVASALAELAVERDYCRPLVDDSDAISIRAGRHPVVEQALPPGSFVPNDTELSPAEQIVILTGPNMAGKSTYLRQVALIVLLARAGCYVPAESARIGAVDRIFTRIGAQDDLAAGNSTFMVEMVETAHILHHATPRSLVVLDEVGRGTSTYDGLSIARAVVEYLHNRRESAARTLFATHYHELTALAASLPRVRNFSIAVAEQDGEVVFLRRIVPGGADRSYGIHVAQLAGLPRAVVHRAEELLRELEAGGPRTGGGRGTSGRKRGQPPPEQLALFGPTLDPTGRPPLLDELAALDVDALTPLDALTRLYELRERARES